MLPSQVPEVAQDRTQFPQIGAGLVGRANIRLRHDLHQRDAGPVEVDEGLRRMLIVQRLAGVLLQMQTGDADHFRRAVGAFDLDLALADDRMFVLADLIPGRQIRVKIVLAIEPADFVDRRVQTQARFSPPARRTRD
jgi:hypothetical protein